MAEAVTRETENREPDYSQESSGPAARLIQACIHEARANTARKDRDRQDWLNLLFEKGGSSQWMVWDRTQERYVERGHDPETGGLPAYVPRCTTNLFANKIDGIASILMRSEPAKEFAPRTDDEQDVAAAEVAEDALPVLLDEIGYSDDIKPRAVRLVTLTDKVLLVPFYDTDAKYGTDIIPDYICPTCKYLVPAEAATDEATSEPLTCETCGAPFELAGANPDGTPIGRPEPIGKMCCEIVPSFELSLPKGARTSDVRKLEWFLTHSRMSVNDIERRWETARGLSLGEAKGHRGRSGGAGMGRHFSDAMAMLSAPSRASGNTGGDNLNDPVVYRLQHDPIVTEEYYFPDGLVVTMVEDHVLEAGPLYVRNDQDLPVKSGVIWQFNDSPGTAFGKPPADDLVPIQEARNICESLCLLILMHDAAPRVFMPLSVTLENEPTGAPGETIYYRSVVPGEKPSQERGINPPEGLYKQIEILDQKMDEVSKLNSVLQGARPQGDPTLGEVEILQEQGMSAFTPALKKLVSVEKQLARLLLWIARESAWSPRFRQVMGDSGEWNIQQFVGADLVGSFDIVIEEASAWPQSMVMNRMMLKEGFAMGLFPPPVQDPELAQKVLRMLNLQKLKPSLDIDRQQVARKIDRWKAAMTPQEIAPPDPTTENLPIHLALLTNFLKSEEFEAFQGLNPETAGAMKQHVAMIGQVMAQQQAAAAAAQNPQPEGKPAERGDDSALRAAVDSGVLKPAGAVQPPADPMEALTASGALTPAGAMPQGGVSIDQLIEQRALTPVMEDSVQ